MAPNPRATISVLATWVAAWFVAGAAVAITLPAAGLPHLPGFPGAILVGVAAGLVGLIAALAFLVMGRAAGERMAAKWQVVSLAAVVGALITSLLAPALGLTPVLAWIAGGVLGAVSGVLTWERAGPSST